MIIAAKGSCDRLVCCYRAHREADNKKQLPKDDTCHANCANCKALNRVRNDVTNICFHPCTEISTVRATESKVGKVSISGHTSCWISCCCYTTYLVVAEPGSMRNPKHCKSSKPVTWTKAQGTVHRGDVSERKFDDAFYYVECFC